MSEQINHIIKACLRGERSAQKQLFDRYNGMLYSISLKYAYQKLEAEEVLQDSWMQIFSGLAKYQDLGKFEGWMKTIVIRTAWKAIRTKKPVVDLAAVNEIGGKDLSSEIMNKMTCEEILNLLQYLPPASRQVFKMYILEEYSHKEIAEILEINESTSRAHLTKARKLLKEKFNGLNKIAHNGLKAI